MTVALFVVAAGVGAGIRHHINLTRPGWRGTLVANVIGAFLLGLVVGRWPGGDGVLLVGTGFCGSLTTYSMFALESRDGDIRNRVRVVVANLVLGVGAVASGVTLGVALT